MLTKKFVPFTPKDAPPEPFSNSEAAWFWYVRCQRARIEATRYIDELPRRCRPCDPDDIYRLAMGLARRGELGRDHLRVLANFGLLERPPDARCPEESRPSDLWSEAMNRLDVCFKDKGIVA